MNHWEFRVKRSQLYRLLGYKSDKMPANESRIIPGVQLPNDYKGGHVPGGPYTVTITPTKKGSYAQHRVFIGCKCGRQIPYGRLAQHAKACDQLLTHAIRRA